MGGGAMRTAAKTAVYAGYRSAAARKGPSLTPAAASSHTLHVASETDSAPLISSASGAPVGAVQSQAWAIDDWDFVGGNEEAGSGLGMVLDPPPRLVFGPVPTLEEAKEATMDLRAAFERVYISPGAEDSVKVSQVSDHEGIEAIQPVSKNVVQAFSLLQGSTEAQDIVASLACDKNVWEAVMNNHKVLEFRNKHQPNMIYLDEAMGENEVLENFSEAVESPNKEMSDDGSVLGDFVQNVKMKVNEMVSNISEFFQDFMGTSPDTSGKTQTASDTSKSNNFAEYFGAFMALAVATIMVVLLKRG